MLNIFTNLVNNPHSVTVSRIKVILPLTATKRSLCQICRILQHEGMQKSPDTSSACSNCKDSPRLATQNVLPSSHTLLRRKPTKPCSNSQTLTNFHTYPPTHSYLFPQPGKYPIIPQITQKHPTFHNNNTS